MCSDAKVPLQHIQLC